MESRAERDKIRAAAAVNRHHQALLENGSPLFSSVSPRPPKASHTALARIERALSLIHI